MEDIIGRTFNLLTVVKKAGKNIHGNLLSVCLCKCGNTTVVQNSKLINGRTKSCGCIRGETLRENLTGNHYGFLTVLDYAGSDNSSGSFWRCQCSCGTIKTVRRSHLVAGLIVSCGCYQKQRASETMTTHGLSSHPLYAVWRGMLQRCYNPSSHEFCNYGGKEENPVYVCDEWRNDFMTFYNWAMANGYRDGLSVDRYPDNEGPYAPWNCRLATDAEQSRNKRNGKLTIKDARSIRLDSRVCRTIAKDYGVTESFVNGIKNGRYWKE